MYLSFRASDPNVSPDKFLSNMRKTDRLHPVISLCVYYGEDPWDGPLCLTDMLEIPERVRPMVSDYKMNLLQLRASETCNFQDPEVDAVFDISRSIYERDYQRINTVYKNRNITSELGIVIGAITQSQKLIDHALESERKGGQVNMCTALEELMNEGRREGRLEGIQATISTCKSFNASKDVTVKNLMKVFSLSEEDAAGYVEEYW